MRQDTIAKIEIDTDGRLHVIPASATFPYIYREAMEVQWNTRHSSLYSPRPHNWSYAQWFLQILSAAREQGCELRVTGVTEWTNVEQGVRAECKRLAERARVEGDDAP
jgi:hypothetical protein